MNNAKKIETWFDLVRILVAVLVAYAIALVILALISDDPLYVIQQFIVGPFSSFRRFGNILSTMIPIIFTGICMCFVYAINKFNLVGEGAVNLGGCLSACVAIALSNKVPAWLLLIIVLVVGCLAGMAASLIPALADQIFHADVCVVSLMMNYILLYLTNYILKYRIKDPGSSITASYKWAPALKFRNIIPKTSVHAGLIVALICVVLAAVLFYKMSFGFKMRIVGLNPVFAKYIGIPVVSTIILAQVIGGAFAGLGGTVQVLGMFSSYQWTALTGYGFDGLMIAVLARKNPALVPLSAFLIAYIRTGADIVSRTTDIPPEFVSIIQGIIIVLVAAEMFLSGFKRRLIFNSAKKALAEKEGKA
jgi:simple sugar transport system permease protein